MAAIGTYMFLNEFIENTQFSLAGITMSVFSDFLCSNRKSEKTDIVIPANENWVFSMNSLKNIYVPMAAIGTYMFLNEFIENTQFSLAGVTMSVFSDFLSEHRKSEKTDIVIPANENWVFSMNSFKNIYVPMAAIGTYMFLNEFIENTQFSLAGITMSVCFSDFLCWTQKIRKNRHSDSSQWKLSAFYELI